MEAYDYDGRKVTTYTTHQWYVVLEVFCVVYVGKPPTLHVVVGLPTCVVGGKPTTTCCCWYILQPTPPTPTHQGIPWNVEGFPLLDAWFPKRNIKNARAYLCT